MRKGSFSLFVAVAFVFASANASAAPFNPPARTDQSLEPRAGAAERGAEHAATARPAPLSSSERARYAEREQSSPAVKNFKGGDATVVIGASTATIILAVVLLVVLL